jgi:sugar lactone lactonase YvrE
MNIPEHVLTVHNQLGETPLWIPEENALYWVDWGTGPICRLKPETGEFTTFNVSVPVTALARHATGGFIAIAQNGLYTWDPKTNEFGMLAGHPDPQKPEICYNDGAVDRQGRLLVGTVNMQDVFSPEGSLFRIDEDGSVHILDTCYATANGLGFSPDGRTVYVTDMRHHQIISLDYDPMNGTVSNRRLFVQVPEDEGMPDGLIVDAEGFIWSGHWDGWRLTRYDPKGKIERQIRFPVQHVISFAFGGKNLDTLFVTTSCWDFSAEDRKQNPLAGDLFMVETGVTGLIEPAFSGKTEQWIRKK